MIENLSKYINKSLGIITIVQKKKMLDCLNLESLKKCIQKHENYFKTLIDDRKLPKIFGNT